MSSHWKNLPSLFTRAYFALKAKTLRVFLNDVPIDIPPKVFKTGNLGWHASRKVQMSVGDARVWCQVGVQVVVLGSNGLPQDGPEGEVQRVETAA